MNKEFEKEVEEMMRLARQGRWKELKDKFNRHIKRYKKRYDDITAANEFNKLTKRTQHDMFFMYLHVDALKNSMMKLLRRISKEPNLSDEEKDNTSFSIRGLIAESIIPELDISALVKKRDERPNYIY